MYREFAVVIEGFGLVITALQVFLVVLLDLGDVAVYFLAVRSSSQSRNRIVGKLCVVTHKYPA